MNPRLDRTNDALRAEKKPRFCSAIKPHINAILTMRYQEDASVEKVLRWLEEQRCPISRRSYHEFLGRVLRQLPMDQARDLGVNVDLLRAVRVRYKLPTNPKGVGAIKAKPTPRHDSRAHRRHILPAHKSQPARTPSVLPRNERRPTDAPTLLPSLGVTSVLPATPKLRGTADKPQCYKDWIVINEMARKKVYADKANRSMVLNYQGTVIHIRTRHEYTEEELMEQFSLSENEAKSCFMSLPVATS